MEFALVPIAFLTSTIAAIIGMGGGILLIACMPGLIPAAAILPVHAATQLASNASRAALGWRNIDLGIVPAFTIGALVGAWLGAEIYSSIQMQWLPALIGGFILVFTWAPLPKAPGGGRLALATLGFYQTGLGMLAGATGPVGGAVLLRRNRERDWLVVNTALYMSLNHSMRLFAFVALGFSFGPYWHVLAAMIVAAFLGSWAGTRIRTLIPQMNFEYIFKALVTLLALRMIALSFW
ncbi:MAG: sulfite exporter TauE/SafE family protein [Pseudomonadota bacterium]